MVSALHREPEPLHFLRRLPFIRSLKYRPVRQGCDLAWAGKLDIRTPQGVFHFAAAAKPSHLTRSSVSQLVAWLQQLPKARAEGILLLAGHIPRGAAESLIEANVNFADDAGNIHLAPGKTYNWTVIGNPAPSRESARRPTSRAELQLLFQFVTHPDSLDWPVRRLESAAGVGKSRVAQARSQMIEEGLLVRVGNRFRLGPANLLAERLVSGYAQVLRPKLVIGRFRAAEAAPEAFLARLRRDLPPGLRYALSGGQAADLLQHFYHGPEVSIFVAPWGRDVAQRLRLLPDRDGPITVLNAFGEAVFWQERGQHMLAPPWLIYAELLRSNDARSHEAAAELRREFLA
jgi:hypothetical protein